MNVNTRYVIGLAGVKQAGKSTVANLIKEIIPEAKEAALADKLKNTCAEVFGLTREAFDRQDLKEEPLYKPLYLGEEEIRRILNSFNISRVEFLMPKYKETLGMQLNTPRQIAQVVGTEVLRAAGDSDIHCKNVDLSSSTTIVSDLRFQNEFDYFNDWNLVHLLEEAGNTQNCFIPIYVCNYEAERKVTKETHQSEKEVFLFKHKCAFLDNNGSIIDTEIQLKRILSPVIGDIDARKN